MLSFIEPVWGPGSCAKGALLIDEPLYLHNNPIKKGFHYPLSLMRPQGLKKSGHLPKLTQPEVTKWIQTWVTPILCTGLPHAKHMGNMGWGRGRGRGMTLKRSQFQLATPD